VKRGKLPKSALPSNHAQASKLGCEIGRDEAGSIRVELLRAHPKLDMERLATDLNRSTTCKNFSDSRETLFSLVVIQP
jgi:hypothetical protein